MKRTDAFTSIRTEGGLLPADLLVRVAAFDKDLAAITPTGYHLADGERINDAINRSWNRLVGAWAGFSESLARIPADDRTATNITRTRWSLVLFQELGYGQLQTTKAAEIDGKTYAVSHGWGQLPVHLVGARVQLDRRTEGVVGAATMSPHGLVQEYLNRSDDHVWGFVSNGLLLRLLRDNATLTRQAYVEFDLEAIFNGSEYPAFAILWMLCHQSRLEGEPASSCVLEQWSAEAAKQGTRALDQLRGGVEAAIAALGTGFLAHRDNSALREALRSGELDKQDYYRQLLRLVYRLLFLFVAEDRDLLLDPEAQPTKRERYTKYYSLGRVRELASHRRGGPHADLWSQLQVVFTTLGRPEGAPELGLPGLGSFLWSDAATPTLDTAQLPNRQLLAAVLALTSVNDGKVRRSVDYRNLGSEELGSIYESLLELHPALSVETRTFALSTAAGNERKTTGSYYTPTSLINELLDTALDPVLAEAAVQSNPEAAILDLKVLDPACGSGHFLIAAAHRIAKRLAAVRSGDDEPPPGVTRDALRDVVGRCLHGIDLNPMAVELCKVSLWMEAMQPGKPLGFLDHRIIRGNALIGATPALLDAGVPDEAFKPLTGDDKAHVTSQKKRNKDARGGQSSLFGGDAGVVVSTLAVKAGEIDAIDDDSVPSVQAKAKRWSELVTSPEYQAAVHAADTWCAAFVAPKRAGSPAVTHGEYHQARSNVDRVEPVVRAAVAEMTDQYGFLHWHLAFLDVYGDRGGFDVVLGNPPWEKVKLSEKEFFANRAPEVAELAGAKRKAAIQKLKAEDPALWGAYEAALRQAEGESHFIRSSGRFPLCGRGDVNTYAVFAEVMREAIASTGRLGVIVPTGIATDDTTKHFFADCVSHRRLVSLFDFENAVPVFEGVHRSFKFCLLTLAGLDRPVDKAQFVFFAHRTSDLEEAERRFTLSPDDLALINPNTKTAPVFRSRRDAEITKAIYRRVPVLGTETDGWCLTIRRVFDMANAAEHSLFLESAEPGSIRTYEAKLIHQYQHRHGSYGSSCVMTDPTSVVEPRYWLPRNARKVSAGWTIAWRDICRNTDERTVISCVVPDSATDFTLRVLPDSSEELVPLIAALNSFVVDYVARQKAAGLHLADFITRQLPVPSRETLRHTEPIGNRADRWLNQRILELTYSAWDLVSFALDLGYNGAPFRWDPSRRDMLRAELDAAFFHMYALQRDDVGYIMDTFLIVRKKDEAAHGEYRTKRLILERYDALAECIANGTEYQTVLDPPPAHPSLAHPESTRPDWAGAL